MASIHIIHKSRNILLNILGKQGYQIDDFKDCSIEETVAMQRENQLDLCLVHTSSKKLWVKYSLDNSKITAQMAHAFFDDDILQKTDNLMFIVPYEPKLDSSTDSLCMMLNTLWNDSNIYVCIMNIHRLLYNLTEHIYYEPHEIMSEEDKIAIYKKHSITCDQDLPCISRYDPVAMLMCMRPGELCKITRKSKTAVQTIAYRICVTPF
jgi:DNA-directed RNA polymerase subunit H (RpoH/RPB5)